MPAQMAEKISVWRSPLATGQIEYCCHSTCTDRTCLHHRPRLARHRPCPVRNRCRLRHRPGHWHRPRPQPQHRSYFRPQPRRHPWITRHCACVDLAATARSADVHRRQPRNRLCHHRPLRCTSHRPFLSTTATPYVVLSRQLLSGWELARA